MKTQSIVLRLILTFTIGIALIAMITMFFSSCKNNEGNATPGTLRLKAASFKQGQSLKSASALAGDINITKAVVNIQDLVIEENSGENGNSQQGNNDKGSDGKDGAEKAKNSAEDGGDLKLAGPFVLDITNTATQIDNVMLQPGTYRKVDFKFVPGTAFDTHSILIEGTVKLNNTMVSFSIVVDTDNTVQLPLAGNGLSIASGISSTLSIVFDVNLWIKNLDFSTATLNNNSIKISSAENQVLYDSFIKALVENIDVEN